MVREAPRNELKPRLERDVEIARGLRGNHRARLVDDYRVDGVSRVAHRCVEVDSDHAEVLDGAEGLVLGEPEQGEPRAVLVTVFCRPLSPNSLEIIRVFEQLSAFHEKLSQDSFQNNLVSDEIIPFSVQITGCGQNICPWTNNLSRLICWTNCFPLDKLFISQPIHEIGPLGEIVPLTLVFCSRF